MRYFRTLTLSVAIHLALGILLSKLADEYANVRLSRNKVTTVELLESPELPRRPQNKSRKNGHIVKQAELPPEELVTEKKDTNLLSEREQRVKREQQARAHGETVNRNGRESTLVAPQKFNAKSEQAAKDQTKSASRGKINFKPPPLLPKAPEPETDRQEHAGDLAVRRDENQNSDKGTPGGHRRERSLGQILPNAGPSMFDGISESHPTPIGDFTALNTNRTLFYSFYSRIDSAIRSRWSSYVQAVMYDLSRLGLTRNKNVWKTELEILLDSDGRFLRAVVHEESGSRKIDAAPVQAFRDARQFPNPPIEMIEQDGMIHLRYAFVVNVAPWLARSSD